MTARSMDLKCKVYVGDLPTDVSETELEKEFNYYGRLRKVWVARNPPGFAFIEFEDSRDADDAVRALDGQNMFGSRIRVEHSSGQSRPKTFGGRGGGGGGGGGRDSRGGGGGGRGPPRYDPYRQPRNSGGRPFDPRDTCYKCGEPGHYAYDCRNGGGGRRRSRSPRDSRGGDRRRRSYSNSRSRSRSPGARGGGRSRSRDSRD